MSDEQFIAEAHERGVQDALAAASWIIDGNTDRAQIPAVLAMIDAGDPRADDYFPAMPNLSGDWADDLTPHKLVNAIYGLTNCTPEQADALCDAYEAGVSETFEAECERILRAAVA